MITCLIGAGALLVVAVIVLVLGFWPEEPSEAEEKRILSENDLSGINAPLPPEDPFGEDGEDADTKRPTHCPK